MHKPVLSFFFSVNKKNRNAAVRIIIIDGSNWVSDGRSGSKRFDNNAAAADSGITTKGNYL